MIITFSDILRRCIVEQVAKMMVLPNKLPIKLSDEIPTVDLRMPEPEVRRSYFSSIIKKRPTIQYI